ncbi:RNA polymerase II-associated protein [Gracilaria domingensis]|nr:RNA polymerase II-associated protein [Gracilaria domingensis]
MPAPSTTQLRARASALQSEEDLLRDQLQFFQENKAVECPPGADPEQLEQQYLAAGSRATDEQTPSSALLPTIEERAVSRRRRSRRKEVKVARPPVATPFPQSFRADLSRPSVFAKRERDTLDAVPDDVPSSSEPPPFDTQEIASKEDVALPKPVESSSSSRTPAQEASSMLASMSLEQIRQAQQEIYATLKPESISFLRQRSSGRGASQPNRSQSTPSETAGGGNQALSTSSTKEESDEKVTETKRDEEVERAKRLWMTDVTETLKTQEHVDQVLQKAVEDMGPIARERFDLDGNVLTAEQIDALPTHKGLHHHGTSPESAGYTLADLLILTRSTILSQRVMALKVLAALISSHGERISEPMLNSDGIRLVFSPLPAAETFHSALTNQVAYLEAVECLLGQVCALDQHKLDRDHYFASEFYSPAFVRGDESPLFALLSETHCIGTLVEIARARSLSSSSVEFSQRALNAIRIIILNSPSSSQWYLAESTNSSRLLSNIMQLAVGPDRLAPSTTMLSCDIIANIIVKASWTGKEKPPEVLKYLLSEEFLLETAAHLNWALRDSPFELSSTEQEAAKGVLRLFRAYLSQNFGLQCISAFLQAICRLVQEADDNLRIEAYLLLEAYIHCLGTKMMQAPDMQSDAAAPEKRLRSAQRGKEPSMAQFAKDQLLGLAPQVVAAAKIVVASGNRHSTSRRAAAGHFVATALAVMSVPFDETYYTQLKCVASDVNFGIAKSCLDTPRELRESQMLASLSHATARILNGKLLEKGFALREVDELVHAAKRERKAMSNKYDRQGGWRLIANACAEWVGLLSRLECSVSIAQTASALLSCLSDVQVILDLTSRCILRKDILLVLAHNMETSEAEEIARKFVPLTWRLLNDDGELRSEMLQSPGDPMNESVLVSLDSLVRSWLKHDGLTSEGLKLCRLLFMSDLLNNRLLFENLVEVPPSRCRDPHALFDFALEVGKICVETEGRLIRAETNTRRSSLSTSTDSQFFNSVVALSDHLVARGPTPLTSAKTVDSLGSIILSIMCSLEADSSLRQNMWSRCVDECGGAALFENGLFLHSLGLNSTSSCTCLEREDMMYRYISAISKSYLDPGRCPKSLGELFCSDFRSICRSRRALALWGTCFNRFHMRLEEQRFANYPNSLTRTA